MFDSIRSTGPMLALVLMASGCAHSRYDLVEDSTLVPPVEVRAARKNLGRVWVQLGQDLRQPFQKSHHNLGTQIVTDSAWKEPVAKSLPQLVARVLQETGTFVEATTKEGRYDYRLDIVLHSLRGIWEDGTWNFLWPWGDMPVEARLDIEIFLWGRDETGKFGLLHFHHRYEREANRLIGPYQDGHRAAAEEIGRLLHRVLERLVYDVQKELRPGVR